LLEPLADGRGILHRDRRAVDDDRGQLAALAGDAVLPVEHFLDVFAGRDDREQNVDVLEFKQVVHHRAAELGERLGLGPGAVPDRHVVAGLDQPLRHGQSHAARPDPTDLLFLTFTVRRHCKLLARLWISPERS
jgi:hypothetical protein